jgi:hypothetical protein
MGMKALPMAGTDQPRGGGGTRRREDRGLRDAEERNEERRRDMRRQELVLDVSARAGLLTPVLRWRYRS